MASISMWLGKGLSGASCSPAQSPNPVTVFGEPFGHAFEPDLYNLLEYCNCSIYLPTTAFDISALTSSHEVAFCYYRLYPNDNGHTYRINYVWKRGTTTIFSGYTEFVWNDTWDYYHGFAYIGWTPCWWWAGGSDYSGYEEIKDDGTDYKLELELYDVTSGQQEATNYINFSVTNIDHTIIYGDIKDYIGVAVDGDIGIKIIDGTDYYREKNQSNSYSIKADGMEGFVDVELYRSGYVIPSGEATVVDGDLNQLDFITLGSPTTTDAGYLQASIEGIVRDDDGNAVPNANVCGVGLYNSRDYGCKTASNGKYALTLHYAGTYSFRALKNNFLLKIYDLGATITQNSKHPASKATHDFTGANCINRVSAYPTGDYAHNDSLAVDQQSVIIPDDPITNTTQIKPTSVGASVVKVKTRRWGSGAAQSTTSTGTFNGGSGYGSGGLNYDGDMGDAEDWEWEAP